MILPSEITAGGVLLAGMSEASVSKALSGFSSPARVAHLPPTKLRDLLAM